MLGKEVVVDVAPTLASHGLLLSKSDDTVGL
jgi:hypothetical protein